MPEASSWIDYKELKRRVPISKLLNLHQVSLDQRGDNLVGKCPIPCPNQDNCTEVDNFSASVSKNCWRCLTDSSSGNVISLHALMTGRDPENDKAFREAALELHEKFPRDGESAPNPVEVTEALDEKAMPERDWFSRPSEKEIPDETNQPLSFALQLKSDVPFLLEDKRFSPETIEEFGLGWCAKGMFAGRIVVPIHNSEGELVGYAGRGVKENDVQKRGKWLFPKGFRKSHELFNQHRLDDDDVKETGVVVTTGFWSAIRLSEIGVPAVSLMGNSLSDLQCQLISERTGKVWLMMDRCDLSKSNLPLIAARLARHAFVRFLAYPEESLARQPEDLTTSQLYSALPEELLRHS
ncbi:MAG: hypothetical protein AAF558_00155 [Verrucomicrobiota bacterium]